MNVEKLSFMPQFIHTAYSIGLQDHPRGLVPQYLRGSIGQVLALILPLACLISSISNAADSELTNYKSGISLDFSGNRGTDFAEEYFYYDKVLDDHKVVYIKAGTLVSMSHNERNIAGRASGEDDYEGVPTTVGQIRYKVDGDQFRGAPAIAWPAYSSPIPFSSMNYGFYGAGSTPVVGTTGPTGGDLTEANRSIRYHRGILDPVGDEWHTLTVADDDRAYTSNTEMAASDGKIWYFVVNPKTPCATWRVSGSGQFYTTPPKKYFFPIIYDQTTYISGTVTCELRDINGNNVFYRINGGAFINAGNSTVTLNQDQFNTGSNALEYYFAGNSAYTKRRIVVKNPGYPSTIEAHGDRLWKSASLWQNEVKPRILGNSFTNTWRNLWQSDNYWNHSTYIVNGARKGYRRLASGAFINAFTARWNGMAFKQAGYTHTAADIAKLALFDTMVNLDPIGYEYYTWADNAIPCREIIYRGYYDCLEIYEAAATYDVLIGYYRADQGYANGITPIQDYFIRDVLAKWTHNSGLIQAGYTTKPNGMWTTAHVTASTLIACMMPGYSTPYYGTCGLDGNATVYPWTPFKDQNYTWKQRFLTREVLVTSYPNCVSHSSPEDMFDSAGNWKDRIAYTPTSIYGPCIMMQYNLVKLFTPSASYSNMNAGLSKAASGTLSGQNLGEPGDTNLAFRSWAGLQNAYFPSFRSAAGSVMATRTGSNDSESLEKQVMDGRPFVSIWYNHNLPLGEGGAVTPPPSPPSPPQGLKIVEP